MTRPSFFRRSSLALGVIGLALTGCRRHHHHADAGTPVSTYPGYPPTPTYPYPGQQVPGVIPGQVPGQMPGMIPGQTPGMVPGQMGALTVVVPPPIATAPDNGITPIPPPGVMRQLAQPTQ